MSRKIFRLFVSLSLGLAIALPTTSIVSAMSFTVNSTADAVDVNPGNGVCATAGGMCTLRAAVQEANALPGDDIITLPAGIYTLTLAGINEDAAAAGDLDITSNLIINGAGAASTIIDGNGSVVNDRVIHIVGAFAVNITGVTITGGTNSGIFSASGSALKLTDSTVRDNTSPFNGGGIRMDGSSSLTLNNSTINGNNVIEGSGGGIFSTGTQTINDSTISNNTAFSGGGIFIFPGSTVILINSAVISNLASIGFGGGILNISGTLVLTNTTISKNTADYKGGGIANDGGAVILTNSSFSGNGAPSGGGGIWTSVNASTILRNTIITNSRTGRNCSGPITDSGGNLSWPDVTCPGINTDPLLGPLANNGGPTQTLAILPGSAAIDAAVDANCPATDQRGVTRPQGEHCDIGAFELEAGIDVSLDIKPGSDTNPINTKGMGTIPVAILSTLDFDAPSMVDISSLTFGRFGDEESLAFCNGNGEYVNSDGLLDLVCHFYTQATGFQLDDTEGILNGRTIYDLPLEGRDAVRILE